MKKVIVLKNFGFNNRNRRRISQKKNFSMAFNNSDFLYVTAVSVLSVIAVLLGSVIYLKSPVTDFNAVIEKYISAFQSGSFAVIFKNLILFECLFLVPCIIFSANLLGSLFINLIPAIKAALSGYCIAYLYNQYELKGVLFSLIFLVPFLSLSCTLTIAMSYEGYKCSKSVTGAVMQRKTAKDENLQLFLVRFVVLTLIEMALTVLNTLLIKSFAMKIILH